MSGEKEEKKNRSTKPKFLWEKLLFGVFAVIFLVGVGIIARQMVSSERSRKVTTELKDQIYATAFNTESAERTDESSTANESGTEQGTQEGAGAEGESSAEEAPKRKKSMNFTILKSINDDAIAWLESDVLEIFYPVMLGEDNDYYLHHLYNGEANSHGSLFADFRNQGDFSDKNTVIYGHYMRDRSMFGRLDSYRSQEFYDQFPTMKLYTPQGDYIIEFFSGTLENGDYEFVEFNFDSDEDFMAYIEDLRSRSEFTSDVEVGPDDRIISLCTCAFDRVNARFMLVGKLVEVYENDK